MLSKSKLNDWTSSVRMGNWVSNWQKQTKTKIQKIGAKSCGSNMKCFFWTQRNHSGFQNNPRSDVALQPTNLCLQYPSYTALVKVRMLIGLSNICLGELCWEKGKTNADNTTIYELFRKAGFLAFSRNRLSPHVKQLVICAINSVTSQTSRGRVADTTVLWHQYCMDLTGTTKSLPQIPLMKSSSL